tara:strand:+ start:139006 stop:139194 length:189 start_codon:yes stop_codon:yes gene_type:complete
VKTKKSLKKYLKNTFKLEKKKHFKELQELLEITEVSLDQNLNVHFIHLAENFEVEFKQAVAG